MKKEEYLKTVEDQIRCKQAREGVREELEDHIEDQTEAYLSEGMDVLEAEEAAVRDMGDPVETGNEMDRIHRPKMPWKSIAAVIILSLAAFALQYILKISETPQEGMASEWIPGGDLRYLKITVAGWCVMTAICYLDYTRIGKYAPRLMLLGGFGILLSQIFNPPINGYSYYLNIGVFGWVISAKMLLFLLAPLYGAILYRYRGQGYRAVVRGVWWMGFSLLAALFGGGVTAVLMMGMIEMVILTAAICKNWFVISKKITLGVLWGASLFLPVLWVGYIMRFGPLYQSVRIQAILNPSSTEAAYQTVMLRKLLSGCKMVGTKAGFLQDAHGVVAGGSYALSMISAYYGLMVAALLALGVILLFSRFFYRALGQKNQMGMIMGIGASAVFLIEFLWYILGNCGYLLVEVYCPFLGYGGSGAIVTYILLGILMSIYRYESVAPEVKIEKKLALRKGRA